MFAETDRDGNSTVDLDDDDDDFLIVQLLVLLHHQECRHSQDTRRAGPSAGPRPPIIRRQE